MSYTVFAPKYRPQTFDDVIGQEHITRTLKNAIEQNRLAHAYIFVGPRGTGKTSTARIMAKALNCQSADKPTVQPCGTCDACKEIAAGTSMDVLEFDAASNTQVDKVRELIIDNVKYAPSHGRYKVYIVDEVHMLSTSSFNALLKTLEEPPAHVKFVFATTDVQKVPTTILSRCRRFDLKRIPTALIMGHLLEIAKKEKIDLTPAAAESVARGAEGGMRDAESMLDQLVAFCGEQIDENDVLAVFGFTSQQTVVSLCDDIISGDAPGALGTVHQEAEAGRDLSRLMTDLINHLRNLLVAQADPEGLAGELSNEAVEILKEQTGRISVEKLLELIEQFAGAEQRMKWASNRKMHFEIAVIRANQTLNQATLSEVLDTLTAIRTGGEPPVRKQPAPRPSGGSSAPRAQLAAAPRIAARPSAKPDPAPIQQKQEVPAPEPPAIREVVPVAEAIAPAPLPAAEELMPPEAPAPKVPVAEAAAPEAPAPAPATVERIAEVQAAEAERVSIQEEEEIAAPPEEESSAAATAGDPWPRLLAAVRQQRPLIAMWVESGKFLGFQGDAALIGFPPDQALASDYCQQANNRKFLEGLLREITGRELNLRCQIKEGLVVERAPEPEPEPVLDPLEQFKNDPLIRKALEIFKAEIQPA